MVYQLGWFSTGRDEAARELLATVENGINKGEIKANLKFVFSNREQGENKESDLFFELVKSYKHDLLCFSSKQFMPALWREDRSMWRLEYDREVMKRLAKYKVDSIVLAGYMLIVSSELCRTYNIINLHPAAPNGPTGTWQEVIWKLIKERAEETGVIIHLVTELLDRGPVITYCKFRIRGKGFDELWEENDRKSLAEIIREGESNMLFIKIRREGVKRELPLLFHTIKALADGRIKLSTGESDKAAGVYDAHGKFCPGGYCMNDIIDKVIAYS